MLYWCQQSFSASIQPQLKIFVVFFYIFIYSQLARLGTARGSGTSLVTVRPTKFKTCKSILFSEGTPEVKIITNHSVVNVQRRFLDRFVLVSNDTVYPQICMVEEL